jgi:hypothetical protein
MMDYEGLFVCSKCYEPRHPQERVRSKIDRQRVPIARPDNTVEYVTTTINSDKAAGVQIISVASIQSIVKYTPLLIQLNGFTDIYWSTFVTATPIAANAVHLAEPLPYPTTSGNIVYITGTGDDFLAIGDVTSTDLESR